MKRDFTWNNTAPAEVTAGMQRSGQKSLYSLQNSPSLEGSETHAWTIAPFVSYTQQQFKELLQMRQQSSASAQHRHTTEAWLLQVALHHRSQPGTHLKPLCYQQLWERPILEVSAFKDFLHVARTQHSPPLCPAGLTGLLSHLLHTWKHHNSPRAQVNNRCARIHTSRATRAQWPNWKAK